MADIPKKVIPMKGKRLLVATLSAALVMSLALPGVTDAQEEKWRQALAATQSGDFATAETLWREVTQEHETWGYGFMMLGVVLGQRNKLDEALDNLQTAREMIESDGERFTLFHTIAQIRLQQSNWDAAASNEDQALQYASTDAERAAAEWGKAQALYGKQDFGAALPVLQSVAQSRSGDASVHARLGRALYETGNPNDALGHFTQAAQIDRDNRLALYYGARIYLDRGDYDQAVAWAQRAVQADPQDPNIRKLLGQAHLGADNYDQAVEAFEVVLQDTPNDSSARLNLGQAYAQLKNYGKAIEEINRALAGLPAGSATRGRALYDLGLAYELAGNPEDALQAFQDSAEITTTAQLTEAIERVQERIRRKGGGGGGGR